MHEWLIWCIQCETLLHGAFTVQTEPLQCSRSITNLPANLVNMLACVADSKDVHVWWNPLIRFIQIPWTCRNNLAIRYVSSSKLIFIEIALPHFARNEYVFWWNQFLKKASKYFYFCITGKSSAVTAKVMGFYPQCSTCCNMYLVAITRNIRKTPFLIKI